ncbi:MAG: hypothetical protein JNM29_10295 [Candidatus Odyssella sp.]|nr:hypothetical protein [Candidatus Odyssella sp.]
MLLAACAVPTDHYVIAASGTSIGLDISFDQARQTPQARLGYHRGEAALVPSNRTPCVVDRERRAVACAGHRGNGAKDTTDVIMELYYGDMFSQSAVIYQRLAVGENAVRSDGAALLFSKRPDGDVDGNAPLLLGAKVDPGAGRVVVERMNLQAAEVARRIAKSDGSIDTERRKKLLDASATLKRSPRLRTALEAAKTEVEFRRMLEGRTPRLVDELHKASSAL